MLEFLVNIDTGLMRFLNLTLANPVFDFIMPILTDKWFVRTFFLTAGMIAAITGGKRGLITFFLLILAVILSDQLAAQVIKPAVGRLRPCHTHDWVHLLVNCSSGKSFPSAHAANSFGQAAVWFFRYPGWRWHFVIAASLIALSRVFVGVHYPFDILAGSVVGIFCGVVIFAGTKLAQRLYYRKKSA
ncbi:MAG: phosphatase PAP2 family protein [candidate division Zixibacteria bacterium]|nr:phosphatase PAP2 family protein [candidate division Zixibacteria bacterium]